MITIGIDPHKSSTASGDVHDVEVGLAAGTCRQGQRPSAFPAGWTHCIPASCNTPPCRYRSEGPGPTRYAGARRARLPTTNADGCWRRSRKEAHRSVSWPSWPRGHWESTPRIHQPAPDPHGQKICRVHVEMAKCGGRRIRRHADPRPPASHDLPHTRGVSLIRNMSPSVSGPSPA